MAEPPTRKPLNYYDIAVRRWPPEIRYKCRSCGLLALAAGIIDREVTVINRDLGDLRLSDTGSDSAAYCPVQAANLQTEFWELRKTMARDEASKALLNKDRNCESWWPFTPTFDPQWHIEDMRMNAFEEARAKRDQEFAALSLKAAEDSKAIAASLHQVTVETGKFTTKWTYIAFFVGALALVGVYLAYLFPSLGPTIGHWLLPSIQGSPKP